MFVIHDSATTMHWAVKYDPARLLIHPSPVQELQVVSGVCSMLEAVDSADRRGGL